MAYNFQTDQTKLSPRADGAKRHARVLIPPRLFTPGETKALAKSKVHQ